MGEICINPGVLFMVVVLSFLLGGFMELRAQKKWNAAKRKPFD